MPAPRYTLVHQPFVDTAARLPKKLALVCDGRRYTYAELTTHVEQLARLLSDFGIKRGDRVALFLDNSVQNPRE